jgi:hypothetical protein
METNTSIETFIKEQIEKWKKQTQTHIPVITISVGAGKRGAGHRPRSGQTAQHRSI